MSLTYASFSPDGGIGGSLMTILGSGFLSTPLVTVRFSAQDPDLGGGFPNAFYDAFFVIINDTTVHVTVPTAITNGHGHLVPLITSPIHLNPGSGVDTDIFHPGGGGGPVPSTISVTPNHGRTGQSVVVSGYGFVGATSVTFNGVGVPFHVVNDSTITATVAPGTVSAVTGLVTVNNGNGAGYSGATFTLDGLLSSSPVKAGLVAQIPPLMSVGPVKSGLLLAIPFLSAGPVKHGEIVEGPDAPTPLTATEISTSEIDLSWGSVAGATTYTLQRSLVSGGPYSTIATGLITSFSDTGLPSNTTFYYVVTVTTAVGTSDPSAEATANTGMLAAPTGLVAIPRDDRIILSWSPVVGAASYAVKKSLVHGGPYTLVGSPGGTTFTATGLLPSTPYFFVVDAIQGGSSPDSAEATATTLALPLAGFYDVLGVAWGFPLEMLPFPGPSLSATASQRDASTTFLVDVPLLIHDPAAAGQPVSILVEWSFGTASAPGSTWFPTTAQPYDRLHTAGNPPSLVGVPPLVDKGYNYVWNAFQDLPKGTFPFVWVRVTCTDVAPLTGRALAGPVLVVTDVVGVTDPLTAQLARRAAVARTPIDFLGNGLDVPFRRGPRDFVSVSGVDAVRARVRQILSTRAAFGNLFGELPWRPDFGAKFWTLRHRGNNRTLRARASAFARDALRWEKSIRVTDVDVEADPLTSPELLKVHVTYEVLDDNLVGTNVILPQFTDSVPITG